MPGLLKTSAKRKVVALFGEVLVDVFPDRKVMGGAPFNVARHLQAFGLHPVLITRTGNDEMREQLLAAMQRYGMDARGVQCDTAYPSGQVSVHMNGNQHRFEILPEQAYDYIHAGLTHMVALAVQPQLIYFGTLAQRSMTSRQALTALIRTGKAPRLLDINLRKPWYDLRTIERSLLRADIVKMNDDELSEVAASLCLPGKSPEEQGAALIRKFRLQQLLVTCGAQGAWQLDKDGGTARAESQGQLQIVDTVGAGDGFAAVLILGTLRNWPIGLTLSRANAFAAALCGIRGATPNDENFYDHILEDWKKCQPLEPRAKILYTS